MRTLLTFVLLAIITSSCGISKSIHTSLQNEHTSLQNKYNELTQKHQLLEEDYQILSAKCGNVKKPMLKSRKGDKLAELTSAIGSKSGQSITFNFTLLNLGAHIYDIGVPNQNFRNKMQYQGQGFQNPSRVLGGCGKSGMRCPDLDLMTNDPVELSLKFDGVLPKGDNVSHLSFMLFAKGIGHGQLVFEFTNIKVDWQD